MRFLMTCFEVLGEVDGLDVHEDEVLAVVLGQPAEEPADLSRHVVAPVADEDAGHQTSAGGGEGDSTVKGTGSPESL